MLERVRHLFNRIVVFLQYCVFSRLAKLPQLQSDISSRYSRFFSVKSAMSTGKVYSDKELCFFRLAKCVVDYSSAALRKVFKREWNKLYPNCRWRGNRRSGLQLVRKEIRSSSRLYLPNYSADYKRIKDNLEGGNTDDWDVTALFFVLKFSQALKPIRYGSRWKKINNAIYQIKEVKNALLSHLPKASLSRHKFERNVDILIQAVEDLLSRLDPWLKSCKRCGTRTISRPMACYDTNKC